MALGKVLLRGPWAIACLALSAATILPGCSSVASLFPDKQKEYRYSTELPTLEIPPDLTSSSIEGAKESARSEREVQEETGREVRQETGEEAAEPSNAETAERAEPASQPSRTRVQSKASPPTATLAQGADNVPLIEVESPFPEAWNDVSRALGRLEVEVSDQNRSDGVFYVYYGGETKKYEDRGLWQDIASVFSGGGPKAQEFRLKLEGKDDVTNIFVLDTAGKPVSEGAGLELLKRLHEKLQVLDKPGPENEKPDSKDEQ